MYKNKAIAVVVPAYNEEKGLRGPVVRVYAFDSEGSQE